MSGSLVGRVLRPVVLLVAGMLIAQTAVSVAATSVSPSATQTRSVSCHALNFHAIDPFTGFFFQDATMLYRSDPGTNNQPTAGFFVCDPDLPDRAVVTRVRFTLLDNTASAQLRYCGLDRSPLKSGSAGTYQTLAQVSPTGMGESSPSAVRKTDSSIEHATVDTTDWAYWLQCRIEFKDSGTTSTNDAGIYGASVDYTISSANG